MPKSFLARRKNDRASRQLDISKDTEKEVKQTIEALEKNGKS